MFDNRSLRGDISLVALIAAIIFLAVSLLTYHPADQTAELVAPLDSWYQPNTLVFPANEVPKNACGTIGATTADILFSTLGFAAFYLLIGLVTLAIAMIRGQTKLSPWIRSLGWALSLIGITCLATLTIPKLTPGPVTGPGGYMGLLGVGMMKTQFAGFGSILLSAGILLAGLMLWTDYLIFRSARWLLGSMFGVAAVGYTGSRKLKTLRRKGAESDDEYEEDEYEEDEPSQIRIRVGGKTVTEELAATDDLDDEYEYEDDSEDEHEEVEDELEDDEDESDSDCETEDEYEDWDVEPEPAPTVVKTAAKKASFLQRRKKKTKEPVESPPQNPPPEKHKTLPGPHFKVRKAPIQTEREQVMRTLDKAARVDEEANYELPDVKLLSLGGDIDFEVQRRDALRKAEILEKTFTEFGYRVKVKEIETGPVIAQYEIQLEAGLRLAKITNLADDLAIALRVPSVRIVAPIPGKNTVGIEVPNEVRQVVRLREVMEQAKEKTNRMKIPIFLGKDVVGDPMIADLASLPHLLIAGRTGTGKSVCLNAIIASVLMTRRPDEVRMLMIDPKMVELSGYGRLPHLMHPVVTDMRKAEAILEWAVTKMEERYQLLAKAGVRHVSSFNQLGEAEIYKRLGADTEEARREIPVNLPFIVIVADEMADLMMTAGKEVEQHIIRLAQKSRAVGIHLIMATQKPTVDVITGLIKSNLPARIAFQVASRTDSRVVLDANGADKLLGNGDMLFLWPGTSTLLRGQGTYVADDEIELITEACSTGEQNFVNELVNIKVAEREGDDAPGKIKNRDELYERAVETVIGEDRGSVSLLQRMLGIGYGRAARLIDFMEEDGVVGPYAGSKSREILVSMSQWHAMRDGGGEETSAANPAAENGKKKSTITSDAQAVLDDILNNHEDDDDGASGESDNELVSHVNEDSVMIAGQVATQDDVDFEEEVETNDEIEDDEEYEYEDEEDAEVEYEYVDAEDELAEDEADDDDDVEAEDESDEQEADEDEYENVDEDEAVAEIADEDSEVEEEEEDDEDDEDDEVEYEYVEVDEDEIDDDDEYEYVEVDADEEDEHQ